MIECLVNVNLYIKQSRVSIKNNIIKNETLFGWRIYISRVWIISIYHNSIKGSRICEYFKSLYAYRWFDNNNFI